MKRSQVLAIVSLSLAVVSGVALLGERDRPLSDRDRFIGAWRLAGMEAPGRDGKITRIADRKGTLMYSAMAARRCRYSSLSRSLPFPTTTC